MFILYKQPNIEQKRNNNKTIQSNLAKGRITVLSPLAIMKSYVEVQKYVSIDT